MPRTFSLARLMIGVTLFCVACAVAVNFPKPVLVFFVAAFVFGPTVVIWFLLFRYWNRPILITVACFIGAAMGFMFFPPAVIFFMGSVLGVPWTGWLQDMTYFLVPIGPPVGAAVIGAIAGEVSLLYDRRNCIESQNK